MFVAGIDPQSYAMHIKCPTLLLSATNSNKFDVDRACDTLAKVPKEVYSAVHYSINQIDRIDYEAYNNAMLFFSKYLQKEKITLPSDIDVKCEMVGGKAEIELDIADNEAKEVNVYLAQEYANPELRGWHKIGVDKCDDGKYRATYLPYTESGLFTVFALLKDKNGFVIGSNIVGKRFKAEDVGHTYKNTILYSSRKENAHTIFVPARPSEKNPDNANVFNDGNVVVKRGPMGIEGVGCSGGLLSFIIGSKKYKPNDSAMFMIDVYAKEQSTLTVKLITNYFGEKMEYMYSANVLGGDVWHNVQIDMNKFKTAEGKTIKEYLKVEAIEIDVKDTEFLINNALWV